MFDCKSVQVFVHWPFLPLFQSVPASELLDQVLDADGAEDDDRIDGLLCGALKTLKSTRAKPGSQLYLSLMYLAKIKPMLFESEDVVDVSLVEQI